MRKTPTIKHVRYAMVASWILVVATCIFMCLFNRGLVEGELRQVVSFSIILGYAAYLLLGCFRGFTLIPAANLLVVGILLIPPVTLFVLTLIGILVSSASIYCFSEFLGLDEYFERTHAAGFANIKDMLRKHELAIIIGWSFCPFAPTDAVCYLCGVLRVNFLKVMVGILIGEGTICAIYIFLGDHARRWLHLRLSLLN